MTCQKNNQIESQNNRKYNGKLNLRAARLPVRLPLTATFFATLACSPGASQNPQPADQTLAIPDARKPLVPPNVFADAGSPYGSAAEGEPNVTVLATGLRAADKLAEDARAAGLTVEGSAILTLSGPASVLRNLEIAATESPLVMVDFAIDVQKEGTSTEADETVYYLAKEDFGLPEFWAAHPTMDGRGVTAGVIDDGVSLFHSGLRKTTTGERKIRTFRSASPELNIQMTDEDTLIGWQNREESSGSLFRKVWSGKLEEPTAIVTSTYVENVRDAFIDWNENGERDTMKVAVARLLDDSLMVCLDLNTDNVAQRDECFGEYSSTGSYRYWKEGSLRNLAAVFDEKSATLSITEGETSGDGHGEGVASVLAGHKIGGTFDGVAPGAQIVDYDLSTRTGDATTNAYTIGTFLRALDWMGTQGVDVANISYSLYFQSVAGQIFMQRALKEITNKHNMVVSFSAGNNGPGLASLNRRATYPPDTLVAGAYVGQKLYEYVHGVTGLPAEGRVVSYSSRGPGPFAAFGPTLISPLASLSHDAAGDGYRAFSGTSSASPALAGLATVLISALRQLELPVYADHVVHALRLSGEQLNGVPFVEQGYGLPKIEKALAVYQNMLKGQLPLRLEGRIKDAPAVDGGDAGGIFLKLSNLMAAQGREFTSRMTAILSRELNPEEQTNTLFPITLQYSAPWVTGPARSFLSTGTSDATFNIDQGAALEAFKTAKSTELFASINVILTETGELLWTIPVTLIHDSLLMTTQKTSATLGTEEVHRHHFSVPAGTRAVHIQAEQIQGSSNGLSLHVYDPTGIKIYSSYYKADVDVILPTPQAGWHQLALTKYKGGAEPAKVKARITPVALDLASTVLDLDSGSLHLANKGDVPTSGIIELRVPDRTVAAANVKLGNRDATASLNTVLTGTESRLSVSVASLAPTSYSYFDEYGHSCLLNLFDENDHSIARVDVRNKALVSLLPFAAQSASPDGFRHTVRRVELSCAVFESTGEESPPSLLRLNLGVRDTATAADARNLEEWSSLGGRLTFTAVPGQTSAKLPPLLVDSIRKSGAQQLEVRFRSLSQNSDEGVSIGVVDIL
jgi:subtilisin family serine protease